MLLNLLLLAASQVLPSSAELGVNTTDMQKAVDTLASTFTSIRNQGLGINALEVNVEYICCCYLVRIIKLVCDVSMVCKVVVVSAV